MRLIERVVRSILGRVEEVPDFCGVFRAEGADDVVEAGLLGRASPHGKVRFYLCEPHFWIGWPKWCQFHADSSEGSSGGSCGQVGGWGVNGTGRHCAVSCRGHQC